MVFFAKIVGWAGGEDQNVRNCAVEETGDIHLAMLRQDRSILNCGTRRLNMKLFGRKLSIIVAIVTAALLGIPAYAAKPVLLKDLAPGSIRLGIVGASQDHLYMSPGFPFDGLFAVDRDGRQSGNLLPPETRPIWGEMIAQGKTVLFSFNDNIHGSELWRSDGTRTGTYLVKDLVPGPESGSPRTFVHWRDKVYFTTLPQEIQRDPFRPKLPQLWRTDGTREGTELVTDLDTVMWFGDGDDRRIDVGTIVQLIAGQDKIFFNVENSDSEVEVVQSTLWQSDGTASGTAKMVYPENNEPVFAARLLESVGNISFFADDQPFDYMSAWYDWKIGKLWRLSGDGQEISTLTDSLASPAIGVFEGYIYFLTRDDSGLHLARTDENATTVETVALLYPASSLTDSVDVIFMAGTASLFVGVDDMYYGGEISAIWAFSSASQAVEKISDLAYSASRKSMLIKDDLLYFSNGLTNDNMELWRSDGTATGTGLYRDLNPTGSSFPHMFRLFAGELWFFARDGLSPVPSIFRTNGTDAIVKVNVDVSSASGSQPHQFTGLKSGMTLFRTKGHDFYSTRGTPETTSIHAFCPFSSCDEPEPLLPIGEGALWLRTEDATLQYTDGRNDTDGVQTIMTNMWPGYIDLIKEYPITKHMLAPLGQNSALFFSVELTPDRTYLRKLWRTDGSASGTTLIKNIPLPFPPTAERIDPTGIEAVVPHQKLVFFMGNDSQHGNELWRTDGSESGTYMVKDLVPGNAKISIENITSARHHVYFTYTDGGRIHLAKSRGSANNTVHVVTLPAGISAIQDVTSVNDSLFFRLGRDLYRSSGQPGNLRRLGRFAYNSSYWFGFFSNDPYNDMVTTDWPAAMTAFGDHLYFIARKDIASPLQVWRADVRKIRAEVVTPKFKVHAFDAKDVNFYVHGNRLFLAIMDRFGQNGGIFELCERGNSIRWVRHTNMPARELRIAGNKIYFAGLDDRYGEEPRVMPLPRKP